MLTEAIVLAGGLGTRLRSVVSDLPKAMAPVAGQPFLTYLLQFLQAHGLRRVVLAIGYKSDLIRGYFGAHFGSLELVYSVEEEPLGTGGAIRRAMSLVGEDVTLVLNGDTFLRLDYADLLAAAAPYPDPPLVVALRRVPDAGRYGAAIVSGGRIQGFAARGTAGPGLINAGCYLVPRNIFQRYPMPAKFSWEHDLLEAHAAQLQPVALECDVPFIDIGVPEAFQQAQTLIPEWVNATA